MTRGSNALAENNGKHCNSTEARLGRTSQQAIAAFVGAPTPVGLFRVRRTEAAEKGLTRTAVHLLRIEAGGERNARSGSGFPCNCRPTTWHG